MFCLHLNVRPIFSSFVSITHFGEAVERAISLAIHPYQFEFAAHLRTDTLNSNEQTLRVRTRT